MNPSRTDQKRPTLERERALWGSGLARIAGVDEAGRGAWAGPVYAAAVILPPAERIPVGLEGVRDSKLLTPVARATQYTRIQEAALAVGVGRAEAAEIDRLGIVPATRLAMARALAQLVPPAQALIIDALPLPEVALPQEHFPCADVHCLSVAAAGIVAKVSRDRWMADVAEVDFAGYGFAQHKGYGTRRHREALEALGVCGLHRRTFRPVAECLAAEAS